MKNKLVRITTVPLSLDKLLSGQLRFMNGHYEVTAISSDKEYLEKIGKKEGIKVFFLEMTRKITPLTDIKSVIGLYRYLRHEKPLIVHSHTPKAGIVGMLAAKLAGVPVRLHTVAGLPLVEETGFKRKVLDFVERVTYACATRVYPNSFGLKKIIEDNKYCHPEKLKVLANGSSNGINTDFFDPAVFTSDEKRQLRESNGISSDDIVFIFVGRLVKDKGINELIAAFSKLSTENKNVKLILVGNTEPELDPLSENTLKEIADNKAIISTGYQDDVRKWFAISDVLAFPSYREGFPNVVMQAGAMGLASIVSDINGCNEIIKHGKNGVIVPVKNEDALFTEMQLMANDTNRTNQMKANSRDMIVSGYGQQTVWNAILEEYKTLGNV